VVEGLGGECVIVLGAHREECSKEIADLPVVVKENRDWELGIGSSIAAGIESALTHLEAPPQGIMICLVDQPLITTEHLIRLGQLFSNTGTSVAASHYKGTPGVPAIFRSTHFENLRLLTGNIGAKSLIARSSDGVFLECDEAAFDIDTATDYAKLQSIGDDRH
jgi:molybdenum cofactor cytidylyltransferase